MMPVPTHLAGWVVPRSKAIDESPLEADIKCPCGSTELMLEFPGDIKVYDGVKIPCTTQQGDNFFLLIRVQCTECETSHTLFDADFHGWNGLMCHDAKQATLPRPELTPWVCQSCDGTTHQASIRITSQGKADFMEANEGALDESRWPDAFEWFSMSIQCVSCEMTTPEWVSYETM